MAIVLASCNQKNKEATTNNSHMMENDSAMMRNDSTMKNNRNMMNNKSNMMDNHTKLYACPMHPEVQGKLNDKCSKCGMKLTEPVPEEGKENK